MRAIKKNLVTQKLLLMYSIFKSHSFELHLCPIPVQGHDEFEPDKAQYSTLICYDLHKRIETQNVGKAQVLGNLLLLGLLCFMPN